MSLEVATVVSSAYSLDAFDKVTGGCSIGWLGVTSGREVVAGGSTELARTVAAGGGLEIGGDDVN